VVNYRPVKTVVSFGETLWDLLPAGPVLGGAPCNFAYRVGSLGERALLVTRLGRDELGQRAFEELGKLGLDLSHVQWDEQKATGTVPVKVDAKGVPDFTILPDVAYDFIEPAPALLEAAAGADCVCFGTLVQRSPVSRRTLHQVLDAAPGALKVLDLNLRRACHTRETVESSLERADVLKLNDDEARWLGKEFGLRGKTEVALAREVAGRWGLDAVVMTLGDRGCLAVAGSEEIEVAGQKVQVADTVGSGDAFSAGFVSLWLKGRPLRDCCEIGNALGALVARTPGATAPVTPLEVELLSGRKL
jgi:fructokinase